MKQPDLFDSLVAPKPASATVYRFPLCRRADLVRATAAQLRSRSYDDGKRYWSAHAKAMRQDLRSAGLSRKDIESEMADYALAVRREVFSSKPLREVSR